MNNRLKELRDKIKSAGYVSIVAPGRLTAWLHLGTEGLNVDVHDLVKLAQRAALPGDAEPTAADGGVTYGEWTTVDQLPYGALFEIQDDGRCGVVINAEHTDGLVECVPVMPCRNRFANLLPETKVRQIHLPPPAPVAPPQEPPTWEDKAALLLERISNEGLRVSSDEAIRQLLAEHAATQGTAGG